MANVNTRPRPTGTTFVRVAIVLGCLVLLTVMAAPAGALADDTIATVARPTPISADDGRIAWSSYDPATSRFSLMTNSAGVTSTVPVKARTVPFDVDLGPARNGHAVAAYSRCRKDPPRRDPAIANAIAQMPDWARGRGCDLYQFDFVTGRESRIAAANSAHASEFLPSVWKGQVVFVRVYDERRWPKSMRPYPYLRSLTGSGTSRRLPGGSRSELRFCTGKPMRCRLKVEPGATAMDLWGRRLAFGWDSGDEVSATTALYLETINAHSTQRQRLVRGSSGNIQGREIVSAAIGAGRVFAGFTLFGDSTSNHVRRHRITTGDSDQAVLPQPGAQGSFIGPVLSTAVDAGAAFYLESGLSPVGGEPGCTPQTPCRSDPGCSDTQPCSIRRARNLAYDPLKPGRQRHRSGR
jgi:hypothetical protein